MTIHWLYQNRIAMPRSWQEVVQAAETEVDVLEVAHDFVAQFAPNEIAQLPEPCRPGRFHDAGDITDYAFALVRHRCDDRGGDGASILNRLSAFFMDANERLSQILQSQRSGNDEHHDQRHSA